MTTHDIASGRGDTPEFEREGLLSPEGWVYASGLPREPSDPGRFHALFGRDSLITSLQVLPIRPEVAHSTLRVLARLQGTRHDIETAEEPGKIIHEYRPQAPRALAESGFPVRNGTLRYYASADSTSWFLVVLAALGDRSLEHELQPTWRAAAEWLLDALDRGDGFVRHAPRGKGGLIQQGWRDAVEPDGTSGGGIVGLDCKAPPPELADADTQAVTLVALRALAVLSGDPVFAAEAAGLAERIESAFDIDTMALDREGKAVVGAGSQLGWLLWSGALSPEAASRFAARLVERDILTAWGIRTLSATHPAFEAAAYHRGCVWPFDSWIAQSGLRAAGRTAEAEAVRAGVLDAVRLVGGFPELYEVHDSGPRRSPQSNQVQAWTVGARWALANAWHGRPERLFPSSASPAHAEAGS